MSNKNPFADFFAQQDFSNVFENFQSNTFDVKAFMDSQMKNIQALTEAQQIAVDNLQSIAQRQSQFLTQLVEDNSKLAKEMMVEGSPEDKLAKNADLFKKLYERSVSNMDEISKMLNTSSQKASQILNKRVSASMNEIKDSLKKAA
jgi:phasin family protein